MRKLPQIPHLQSDARMDRDETLQAALPPGARWVCALSGSVMSQRVNMMTANLGSDEQPQLRKTSHERKARPASYNSEKKEMNGKLSMTQPQLAPKSVAFLAAALVFVVFYYVNALRGT